MMILTGSVRAFMRAFAVSLFVIFVTGCTSDRLLLLTQENGTDLDAAEVERLRATEDIIVYALAEMSGIDACPPANLVVEAAETSCAPLTTLRPDQWEQVLLTGLRVADRECEQYLAALFWFDRAQRRTVDQIGLGAVAAAAIAGLTGGSAEAISIMTTAFGLAAATVQNVGSGLLYDIGPSAVYEIVESNQSVYKAAIDADLARPVASFDSRPAVMWAIQNYAAICLPPQVETEIRRAVENAEPEAKVFRGGIPPTVGQNVVTTVRLSDIPEERDVAGALLDFTAASPANVERYLALADARGIDIDMPGQPRSQIAPLAIIAPENAAINAAIARELNLLE